MRDAPLRLRRDGRRIPARLLTAFEPAPAESRRDSLSRLARWARCAEVTVAVLPTTAAALLADLRALGFDDAGPLPRYFAPARPGFWRRALTAAVLPPPLAPEETASLLEALPPSEENALRRRLAGRFGAISGSPGEKGPPIRGVHLVRAGLPVASARWEPAEGATVEIHGWLAPPDAPDLAALLAGEVLRAAAVRNARGVSFETTHETLRRGLVLARFLPRPSRARVLVRQGGDRQRRAPSTSDWHLTGAARIGHLRAW